MISGAQSELHHRATHGEGSPHAVTPPSPPNGEASSSPSSSLLARRPPACSTSRRRVASAAPSCASRASLVVPLLLALALLPGAYLQGVSDGVARANRAATPRAEHGRRESYKDRTNSTGTASNRRAEKAASHAAAADFVFLVAIEGSGHHFYEALYDQSPMKARLERLGIPNTTVMDLHLSLWDNVNNFHMKETALLSAPCANATVEPNGTSIIETLSRQMRLIDDRVRNASLPNDGPTMIPLNAALVSGPDGMMSYPNFSGDCRYLQYPDLDALYHACDVAGVVCHHVVLTRDPYAAFRSTYRRFNNQTGAARSLRMYTTMLDVIFAQIEAYPDRLAVCWAYTHVAEESLGAVLGWDGNDDESGATFMSFRGTYASLFRGKPMTDEERLKIIQPELAVYMSSMVQATERVQRKCREVLHSQQYY